MRDQIIGTLSKGYRQRVGLATAILHNPRVLVLDEPTVGLDPKQIISIRELIRELGRQHTLLLSTHILPEVELLCDRVVIIDEGRIIAEGTPESLRERWTGNPAVRVDLKDAPEDAAAALAAVPGIVAVHPGGIPGSLTLECEPGGDPREAVFRTAVERGWVLLELARDRGATLEDIFVRLTTHDTAAGATAGADRNAAAAAGGGFVNGVLATYRRELRAFFFSPLAYIVLFFFLVVNGVIFVYLVGELSDPALARRTAVQLLLPRHLADAAAARAGADDAAGQRGAAVRLDRGADDGAGHRGAR